MEKSDGKNATQKKNSNDGYIKQVSTIYDMLYDFFDGVDDTMLVGTNRENKTTRVVVMNKVVVDGVLGFVVEYDETGSIVNKKLDILESMVGAFDMKNMDTQGES